MLRILNFLFTGDWHLHQWEDAGKIIRWREDEQRPHRFSQPMKCKICGNRKSVDL